MENTLKLRMYGLVAYQLCGTIHAGIQFGHAVVEYGNEFKNENDYIRWATNDKTFIILNGGTTNTSLKNYGTLNSYRDELIENNIIFSDFSEPDLGDQLTAIVFLVDERVFNYKDYPDFKTWLIDMIGYDTYNNKMKDYYKTNEEYVFPDMYKQWVNFVGGEKNVFLKTFLKGFKLA